MGCFLRRPKLCPLDFPGNVLRVLTFNLRRPSPRDTAQPWEKRRWLIRRLIQELDPDLIATQELTYEAAQFLHQELDGYRWFGRGRYGGHVDEHVAIFFKRKRLSLYASGDFWLSETPTSVGSRSWGMDLPRIVTWGAFEELVFGRRLVVVNTHFPHRPQDAFARAQCARTLVSFLKDLPEELPSVLAGDFNSLPTEEPYQILTAHLKDSLYCAREVEGAVGTYHEFTGDARVHRIDWILFRGNLKVLSYLVLSVQEEGVYPSDHFPVCVDFEIPSD